MSIASNARNIIIRALDHQIFETAAAIAFYTLLALVPLSTLLVTFLNWLPVPDQNHLWQQVENWIGSVPTAAIQLWVQNRPSDTSDGIGLFDLPWTSALALLISLGGLFGQIRSSFQKLVGVKEVSIWGWLAYPFTLVLNVLGAAIFLFVIAAAVVLSSLVSMSLHPSIFLLTQIANFLISVVAFAFIFTVLYWLLSRQRLPLRVLVRAGLMTGFMFFLGSIAIGLYLGSGQQLQSDGVTARLLAFLVWIYYSCFIVLASAEAIFYFEADLERGRPQALD